MIKLEPHHMKNADTFVPQKFLENINKEIERQWIDLLKNEIITVKCMQHWPKDTGKKVEKHEDGSSGTIYWYDQECGECGEPIFPVSWETAK